MIHAPTMEAYIALLEGKMAQECGETLEATVREHKLRWANGNPICKVMTPYFMAESAYESGRADTQLIDSAIHKLVGHLVESPSGRAAMNLDTPGDLMALALDGPRHSHAVKFARIDGFWGPDGQLRFVELNTQPFGPVASNIAADAFASMGAFRALAGERELRWLPTRGACSEAILAKSRDLFPDREPAIAAVWPADLEGQVGEEIANETLRLQSDLERAGVSVVVTTPDGFEYDGALLRAEGKPVCFVFANLLDLIGEHGPGHPAIQAMHAGKAESLDNATYSLFSSVKALFAGLSDPSLSGTLLSADERDAVSRAVPWTRILRDEATTFGNVEGNLIELCHQLREQLVLKPNGGEGAKGVVLGWRSSEDAWRRALHEALEDGDFVVQQRVSIPAHDLPVWRNGEIVTERRHVSFDPFLFYGAGPVGALLRSSTQEVINLTQGGDLLPLCIVCGA